MFKCLKLVSATLILILLFSATVFAQQGITLSGAGVVNRSFGGTAVAAPIDVTGAIMWNPATISGFDRSEVAFSLELLQSDTQVRSSLGGLSGQTSGDHDAVPIPSFAFVHKPEGDSPWTYGLGFYTLGGFNINYPVDTTNPILTPQPPVGGGLGRVVGEAAIYQIAPTVSYDINSSLSFGFAPTLSIAKIQVDPMFFGAPNSTGAYAPGADSDYTLGGGFQVGLYYNPEENYSLGISYKSPQWFDSFDVNTVDASGLAREISYDLDYAQIVAVGGSYEPCEDLLFATDVKYIMYGEAEGFGDQGYAPDGRVMGLGWDNIFSVSTGVQKELTESISLRLGYLYNQNPISGDVASFNVVSPLITQHLVSAGASFAIDEKLTFSLAYLHAFESDTGGPIVAPGVGAVPGSSVESTVSADAIAAGFTLKM